MKLIDNTNEKNLYIAALVSCFIILIISFRLWEVNFNIPLGYSGDYVFFGSQVKAIIDNGWYLQNNFLGMPFGQLMYDYPSSDNVNNLIIKAISSFIPNYAVTLNLFYLLTFPLTTLTAIYVFRQLKISEISSFFGSLIYTFLPYHFRLLDLSVTYYLVPLIVLVILWIYQGEIELKINRNNLKKGHITCNLKLIISIIICILVSCNFFYYSFFSCFFLFIVAFAALIWQKNKQSFYVSLLFIFIIVFVTIVNLSPSLAYQYENAHNQISDRSPGNAETYGLKITQLLIPVRYHQIPFLAFATEKYSTTAPLVNENASVTLGIVGSIGFLFLLLWLIFREHEYCKNLMFEKHKKIVDCISILNLSGILLATIGGFGSLIAYAFLPQVRAYSRIFVFIAFFSVLAIVILLDTVKESRIFQGHGKKIFSICLIIILLVGIYDITPARFSSQFYVSAEQKYSTDENFVKLIENDLPENSMIFQLPFVSFLTYSESGKMGYFDGLKPYLHSSQLKWSYGAMYGRQGDYWQREISSLPPEQFVKKISFAGFNGIYIDTFGYADNGRKLISDLKIILKIEPITDEPNRYYFFSLVNYSNNLKSTMTNEEWSIQKNRVLNANLQPEWVVGKGWQGIFDWDGIPTSLMGTKNASQVLYSETDKKIRMSFQTKSLSNNRILKIYLNNQIVETFQISTDLQECIVDMNLKKGKNTIMFDIDGDCVKTENQDGSCYTIAIQHFYFANQE